MTSKHDQGLALERALAQAEEMLQEFESNNPIEPLEPMNSSTQALVLVDGIPRVDMSKYEKLCTIIRKIFSSYGSIVDDGYYVPVAGTPPMTLGYCIIEFNTVEEARRACAEGDFKKLDAAHTLRVTPYDDYEKLQKMPDVYVPPDAKEYSQKSQLTSWLLDESGRDQFVIRHGSETQIYWHDPVRKAAEQGRIYQYGGEREKERGKTWTESYVAWSPRGSYFATFHQQGIALWGGEQFEKLQRMAHTGVSVIDFSPNEKYLITSNGTEQEKKTDPECLIVWDVRSGNKLRGFEKGIASTWPVFKWSHDDTFIARTGRDMISVYEVPGMGLLDKKSIKVPDVQDIAWSPSDNLLSYWVPEKANTPAVVAIVELPSKKQVRERHFYNVSDLKMHWQDAGEYLCVKFLRRKTKTKMTTSFEIFRMKQKDIPVEVVELSDAVIAFAWEPKGHRFAIIHGDAQKPNVSIYTMEKKKISLTKTFESRSANCLFWSPLGSHLVVAGLGTFNGQLEFFDIDSLESLGQNEHFMCTDVDWDPSGRYVMTAVTQPLQHGSWKHAMENGYRMWTHQGQLLVTQPYENLYQSLWRPRPPTLLSATQIAELRRTLRDRYWRRFESEDDEIRRSQLSGRERDRDQLKQAWKQYRAAREREYQEEAAKRQALRGGIPSEDEQDYEIVEQWVEEEMSREEELAPL